MMKASWRFAAALVAAACAFAGAARADLIAYYPLDEFSGLGAEDVQNGYNMEASANLGPEDVVAGRFGNAFSFTNTDNTLLTYVANAGDALPITQHPSFTVSMWVQGDYSTMGVNDLRAFAEADLDDNTPLFNLGTTNNGSGPQLDYYGRNTGSPNSGTHRYSELTAFDGEWHSVIWMQEGTQVSLYIDGVLDGATIPAVDFSVLDPYPIDNTTIGGIGRAAPSHWITALIDDVSLWDEVLPPPVAEAMGKGNMTPLEAADFVFIPGDFNLDSSLDLADYDILRNNFREGMSYTEGDMNGDGTVDLYDFSMFAQAYADAGAAAVPEPGALALAAAAAGCVLMIRRSRGTN